MYTFIPKLENSNSSNRETYCTLSLSSHDSWHVVEYGQDQVKRIKNKKYRQQLNFWQPLPFHVFHLSSIFPRRSEPKPLTPVAFNAINLCAFRVCAAFASLSLWHAARGGRLCASWIFLSPCFSDASNPHAAFHPAGSPGQRDPVTFDLSRWGGSLSYKLPGSMSHTGPTATQWEEGWFPAKWISGGAIMKYKHTVGPNPRPLSILAPQSLDPLLFLHPSKHGGRFRFTQRRDEKKFLENMITGSVDTEQVLHLCYQKQGCNLKGSKLFKSNFVGDF